MKQKVTSRCFYMMSVMLTLLCLCSGQYYSNRTKCSENMLTFDSEISLFYQNTQFSGINYTQIINVMGMIKTLYQYGNGVNQTIMPQHRCKNYFLNNPICCRYFDLDTFINEMLSLYNRTYFLANHPAVDYVYKIFRHYKIGNASCLNNYDLNIPDRYEYTFANATAPLGDLIKNISNEMDQLKNFQLDFIVNSACTLCIGVEDFKTFLYPTNSNITISNRLIYNQAYFSNATAFIAQRMWNSKQYADQIQNFINTQLVPRLSNDSQCADVFTLITNSTQINARKVCQTYDQCLKFAQKYIGAPGAPAYSKVFASISQYRGITKTNSKVVTSNSNGFKGNQTYTRYLSDSPPTVIIKGNDYTYGM